MYLLLKHLDTRTKICLLILYFILLCLHAVNINNMPLTSNNILIQICYLNSEMSASSLRSEQISPSNFKIFVNYCQEIKIKVPNLQVFLFQSPSHVCVQQLSDMRRASLSLPAF